MNGYDLSRSFWDFSFENPDTVKPNHIALYFFAIEHCNRLGWKKKFGLPTSMAMEAINIKSYNTYIEAFRDLVEWGFIELVQKSKNQYSSNIIALSKFDKALDKALDKAIVKHDECSIKKHQSTIQSTVQSKRSIDKHINNNIYIKDETKIFTTDDAFKIFDDEGVRGRYFSKISEMYSMNDKKVKSEFNKWKLHNEDNNFNDEKHLKNSFNLWMRNVKPDKKELEETTGMVLQARTDNRNPL